MRQKAKVRKALPPEEALCFPHFLIGKFSAVSPEAVLRRQVYAVALTFFRYKETSDATKLTTSSTAQRVSSVMWVMGSMP